MLKIRTHKDAFKAYLAPEKYEQETSCSFCDHVGSKSCSTCVVEFYCCSDATGWPLLSDDDERKVIRYLLRNLKKWGRREIERLARKKAIALGYKFERRRNE